jgi:hypothetical protein
VPDHHDRRVTLRYVKSAIWPHFVIRHAIGRTDCVPSWHRRIQCVRAIRGSKIQLSNQIRKDKIKTSNWTQSICIAQALSTSMPVTLIRYDKKSKITRPTSTPL